MQWRRLSCPEKSPFVEKEHKREGERKVILIKNYLVSSNILFITIGL